VEPMLLYLCDRYLRRNGVWVRNTARAAAEDLHDWWSYLSEYTSPGTRSGVRTSSSTVTRC
jgi:hypothetical protein